MLDLVIHSGNVVDGSGGPPQRADIAVRGDRIVGLGTYADADAIDTIDASGLVVAPGFVNPLSHSYYTMLQDPRSLAELVQGVTTQVFGEGESMGPLSAPMHTRVQGYVEHLGIDADWTRLSEFLELLAGRGVTQNVCSFIGASTLREAVMGYERRPPTAAELNEMRGLVDDEMADGALGLATALVYPPGFFASTDELVEICKTVTGHGGTYISHIRGEGTDLLSGLEELLTIADRAAIPAEVFHLKACGEDNWSKMAAAIDVIESARHRGMDVTANVYPYTAGGTQLSACIPPWYHEGGHGALVARLRDRATRAEIADAMRTSSDGWENFYLASGGAEGVLILHTSDPHRSFAGMTVAQIADRQSTDPVEAILDMVEHAPLDENWGIFAAFFMMSEDNIERQLSLPWVSIGSDASSMAAEGEVVREPVHPRTYGSFARFLGHYVRDRGVATLPEAVRRLSALPATHLGLRHRGRLEPGWYADITVFDPATVADRATYADPHRYATGVHHVVVNGRITLRNGEFTGVLAGRKLSLGR